MSRYAAMILLLFCASADANIYRCDRNGKLEFSDRACVVGQIPLEVAAPNVMQTSAGDRALAQAFDAETASLHALRAAEKARMHEAAAREPKASRSRADQRRRATKPKAIKLPKAAVKQPKTFESPRQPVKPKNSSPRR